MILAVEYDFDDERKRDRRVFLIFRDVKKMRKTLRADFSSSFT